jgi:hypothetical protein
MMSIANHAPLKIARTTWRCEHDVAPERFLPLLINVIADVFEATCIAGIQCDGDIVGLV